MNYILEGSKLWIVFVTLLLYEALHSITLLAYVHPYNYTLIHVNFIDWISTILYMIQYDSWIWNMKIYIQVCFDLFFKSGFPIPMHDSKCPKLQYNVWR